MKINYNRPKLTSSTINQKKDFDQLHKLHVASTLPFYKKGWFIGTVASCTIFIGIILYLDSTINTTTSQVTNTATNPVATGEKKEISTSYPEDTPCNLPPSKYLRVPTQQVRIDPNKKQTVALKKSKITIPKHAFLDANNTIVTDSVLLSVKIMHDPIDFILSGIPMEYDSAGFTYIFESGGMFEIQGTDIYNNPITINKETPLIVSYEAKEGAKDFNFYELDSIKADWKYLSSNTIRKEEKTFEADKTHSFDATDWKSNYREQNIANQKWKRAEKEVITHEKTKPNAPAKVKNASQTFTLDIDKNQFPELASFTEQQFEPISNKLDPAIYSTEWTSIKLREHKKGESYQLILQNDSKMEALIAKPVYEGKNWAKAQHLYSDKYARYTAILEQKEEKAATLKEDYEKKKKQFDAIDKLKGKVKEITKTVAVSLVAPIQNFGIFNFDRPLLNRPKSAILPTIDKAVKVKEQPKFTDINGKEFNFEKIYVVESKQNAYFAYNLKTNPYFSYNENATIHIIGFNTDKELILITDKNFKKAINTNNPFIGKLLPNTTINQLKEIVLES